MEYTAFIIYLCRGDASLNLHCCTSRVWTACLIEQRFTYGKSHGDSSRQINGSKGMEETKLDRLITQWKCQKVWGESTMHQWCDQKRDTKCHHPTHTLLQLIHWKPLWRFTTALPKASHALRHTTTKPNSRRIANAQFMPWKIAGCGRYRHQDATHCTWRSCFKEWGGCLSVFKHRGILEKEKSFFILFFFFHLDASNSDISGTGWRQNTL